MAIGKRLAECGLKLNLQKSAIVYCKDSRRREVHACKQFTFLGYTFRPRGAKNRHGKLFDSFLPAVSSEATKKMLRTIKSWKLSRQILAITAGVTARSPWADLRFQRVLRGHNAEGRFTGGGILSREFQVKWLAPAACSVALEREVRGH